MMYDGESQPCCYDIHKIRYCHVYYEVLDLAAGKIEGRFDHNDLDTVKQIEMLLVNASNEVLTDSFNP